MDSATHLGGAFSGSGIQSGPSPVLPVLHTLTPPTRPHIVIFTGKGSTATPPTISYLRPAGGESVRLGNRKELDPEPTANIDL